jgi:hypothetical protein
MDGVIDWIGAELGRGYTEADPSSRGDGLPNFLSASIKL